MLAKLKEYIVVCIHCTSPLAGSDLGKLQERIVSSRPHYWEELEPGIIAVYFAIRRGGRTRSLKLTTSLGSLKKPDTVYHDIGVGNAVGELITETNWYGKIITAPFGDAVNQAMKKAREDTAKSSGEKETVKDEER